jgi:polyisoprenoid-binding protein YceI
MRKGFSQGALLPASIIVFTFMLSTPTAAAPVRWNVDQAASRIAFSGTNSGAPFKGNFSSWAAVIDFDPKDLAHSRISVTIQTASANTGDKFQESSLGSAEWFNSAKQPRATFVSTRLRAGSGDQYLADGVLTIKGRAVPVTLPFRLKIAGDKASATGQLALDRTKFDLGMTSDPKGAWVSRAIQLSVSISARRAK